MVLIFWKNVIRNKNHQHWYLSISKISLVTLSGSYFLFFKNMLKNNKTHKNPKNENFKPNMSSSNWPLTGGIFSILVYDYTHFFNKNIGHQNDPEIFLI